MMSSAIKNVFGNSLKTFKHLSSGFLKRNYLTTTYQCNEAFNNRHNENLIKSINSNHFYVELMQRKRVTSKVFAIDVDLFIQSISSDNNSLNPDDLDELLHILRRSPETINTLQSTWHTTLRLLMENNYTDYIFKFLSQPLLYGIYLDTYVANLLLDHYLVKEDYTHASRIAFHLMLTESYGNSLTHLLSALSCLRWAGNQADNKPWLNYQKQIEQPEEEVLIREDYHPNPFFDDHFHLTDATLCVGKTLAWGADANLTSDVKLNCQLLGYSLWKKWNKLNTLLNNIDADTVKVSDYVVTIVKNQVLEHCIKEDLKTKLTNSLERVKTNSEFDLISALENEVNSLVKSIEIDTVDNQEKTYAGYAQNRLDVMEAFKEEEHKNAMIDEIKLKKKDLLKEEQTLMFFQNEKKIDLVLEQRGQYKHPFPRPRPWKYSRIRQTKLDEEYIPPEIKKRGGGK